MYIIADIVTLIQVTAVRGQWEAVLSLASEELQSGAPHICNYNCNKSLRQSSSSPAHNLSGLFFYSKLLFSKLLWKHEYIGDISTSIQVLFYEILVPKLSKRCPCDIGVVRIRYLLYMIRSGAKWRAPHRAPIAKIYGVARKPNQLVVLYMILYIIYIYIIKLTNHPKSIRLRDCHGNKFWTGVKDIFAFSQINFPGATGSWCLLMAESAWRSRFFENLKGNQVCENRIFVKVKCYLNNKIFIGVICFPYNFISMQLYSLMFRSIGKSSCSSNA